MSYTGFERTFSEVFTFVEMRGFWHRASSGADLCTLVWGSYRVPERKRKYWLNVQKCPNSWSWLIFISGISMMQRASHLHYCMHETRIRQGQLERFLDWLASKLVEIKTVCSPFLVTFFFNCNIKSQDWKNHWLHAPQWPLQPLWGGLRLC